MKKKTSDVETHPIPKARILILGETRVGKSSFIRRLTGFKFMSQYSPTIGIDYAQKQFEVDGIQMLVHFWDISGDDSYFEVRNEFYSDSDGFLLIFDLTDRSSFNQIGRWIEEGRKYGADFSSGIICGNKADQNKICVSNDEANSFAKRLGMYYFDISAKTGLRVDDACQKLLQVILNKMKRK